MGFLFNGKHSETDFDLVLEKKTILPPQKKKIKEVIPFMNGSYDFSTIGSSGEQVFEERKIEVVFDIIAASKTELHAKYSQILAWLVDTGQQELIFDDISAYYYMAEVEDTSDFEEIAVFGKMKVNFVCHPFKVGEYLEGDNMWDTFNFETDILQDVSFDVAGTMPISIINPGRAITPTVNASAANMSVVFGGKTYSLTVGDNKVYGLRMQNGANSMTLNGTGHIVIAFRREML